MAFLNPILLAGLAAVSVPILIHLLNRRKFQKVVWAAMRFLQLSVERNQRRLRVEDMILLALRCLLLALLALALARPAVLNRAAGAFQSKVTAVIIIDNSYSMGVSDGTRTRLELAREAAEQALDTFPAGSATAVLWASDLAHGAIPEPTFDLHLARKTIRETPLSDRATDLFPAIDRAVGLLKDRLALRKEVYLVTDGQALGWRQLGEIQKLLAHARSELQTHVVLVGEPEPHNVGISDLRLAGGLAPVRQPLRFEIRVTNYGREEVRDVHLTLSVDGEPPSDEFTVTSLAPGATRNVSLFAKLQKEGPHAVTARIPADRLAADDHRTLAVRAIQQARVLLVDGEPGNAPREGEVYFLRKALVPLPPELREGYFLQTMVRTVPDLGGARLDDFDAVVLANVAELGNDMLQRVEDYVRRGGGLVIFPGARVNLDFYNRQLYDRLHLLPARLGPARGQADSTEQYFGLQDKDYQHPIVTLWNDPAAGTLGSARFFQAYDLIPETGNTNAASKPDKATEPQAAGTTMVVMKYADGRPAVVERPWGLGRVVLFSSTADTAWNDLPVRLAFVPLIHRTVGAVIGRQDENLNVRVGEAFHRRLTPEFVDKDVIVTKPGQTEAMRDFRRVELADGWPVVRYEQTDYAGVYDARISDPPLTLKFAAQPNAEESNLEPLADVQRGIIEKVAGVVDWKPGSSLRALVEKERTGLELWLPLLAIVLMLAAVETFLAQRFSMPK